MFKMGMNFLPQYQKKITTCTKHLKYHLPLEVLLDSDVHFPENGLEAMQKTELEETML